MTNRELEQQQDLPRSLFGYDVVDFIGEGAGSTIYVVSHPDSRQLFALKHVVRKTERHARFLEQLDNEYQVSRLFSHPALRRSIELKQSRSLFFKVTEAALIMEMFDGTPLDLLPSQELPRILSVFIQAAGALESLHAMGFVHCDLKPNNILLGPTGSIKVIDFGQACKVGTVKERIQGTPDFISPEQVRREAVTVRTDIFNFGATLYWSLTRRKLPTLFTVKKSANSFLVHERISTPREANSSVPEPLSNLVMECVHTNPDKRPASMADLSRRLEIMHHSLMRSQGQDGSAAVA